MNRIKLISVNLGLLLFFALHPYPRWFMPEGLFQIGSEGEGLVHCTVVVRELTVAQRVEHRKRKSIRTETDG